MVHTHLPLSPSVAIAVALALWAGGNSVGRQLPESGTFQSARGCDRILAWRWSGWYIYTIVYVCVCACMHTCVCQCLCVCVCVFVRVYVHVCVYRILLILPAQSSAVWATVWDIHDTFESEVDSADTAGVDMCA